MSVGKSGLKIVSIDVGTKFVSTFISAPVAYSSVAFPLQNRIFAQALPGVCEQVCVSKGNKTFGQALAKTPLAHIAEHVAIEVSVQAGSKEIITGKTARKDLSATELQEQFGLSGGVLYLLELSFENDFVALAAIRGAIELINALYFDESIQTPEQVQYMFREIVNKAKQYAE